ncbi:hypothetical protein [Dyella caseinilytica]|uniref:Peptidase M50B-like protein n=1 Tax=Dyella caseinilytica TaxID=1849581 RepID=A0ABX7GYU3_9GAMM|nr:hypothetical protein [Dyella caseinilytica]QRN55673.1 hypothetical protein ISN74_10305 [Dyella caseinilytica]GGA03590.1 hypothetical protein GCM10011408_26420 [Dyella caseinilytica]
MSDTKWDDGYRGLTYFLVSTALMVLLAHAVAYLAHEYCHAFTAWMLGYKQNPLALNYGEKSVANILFQQDIDENVDYDPLFAAHKGFSAALIALAGPGMGNGFLYFICLWVFRWAISIDRRMLATFFFWLALMCAGNVWGYAPTRTITTHADMALAARGLGISTWLLFPFVTAAAVYIAYSFFFQLFAMAKHQLFGGSTDRLVLVSALVSYFYFGFFGGGEISGHYGAVPALFSTVSLLILLPLSALFCIRRL